VPLTPTETAARAMSKPDRVAYLKAHGWERMSSSGSQTWIDPETGHTYTLALAVRVALDDECPPAAGPPLRATWQLRAAAAVNYGTAAVCDGCHATPKRIQERGHFGGCTSPGTHEHSGRLAIVDCPHWWTYAASR
jgi:hypothetical protein